MADLDAVGEGCAPMDVLFTTMDRLWADFDPTVKECWLWAMGKTGDEIRALSQDDRWAAVSGGTGMSLQRHLVPLVHLGVAPATIFKAHKAQKMNRSKAEKWIQTIKNGLKAKGGVAKAAPEVTTPPAKAARSARK